MSCCGQKRALLQATPLSKNRETASNEARQASRPYLIFRYEGTSACTYTGPVTRKPYRFNFRGETRMIDSRDAGAFMAEPLLKQIILP